MNERFLTAGDLTEVEELYGGEGNSFISIDTDEESITVELGKKDEAIWRSIFTGLPKNRVLKLAMYAKKARTRKKNTNRLVRYWRLNNGSNTSS